MSAELPIVILPGNMCDERAYLPQFPAFQTRAIQVADLASDISITDMARRTLASAPKEFILFGHSMGGITGLELLRQAPERIKGAILMATNPQDETLERRINRQAVVDRLEHEALPDIITEVLLPKYFAKRSSELEELIIEMAIGMGKAVFRSQAAALMHRVDSRDALDQITVPTLLICGRQDQLVSVETHRAMVDKIAGADMAIIETAGHFPGMEVPAQVNEEISSWLQKSCL